MLDTAKVQVDFGADNKCGKCTGSLCCTYITHKIDTPRTKDEFDYLLWQVSHENISVYKDTDGWYLLVSNPCVHIVQPGGGCAIYDKRPDICREHSNDFCEFDQPCEDGWDLYFDTWESLRAYCKKRFKRWAK